MKKINASVCAVSHMGIAAEQNEDNLFINGKIPDDSELEKGFIDVQNLSEPFVLGVCDGEGGRGASAIGVAALNSHKENLLKSGSSSDRIFENCIVTANEEICVRAASERTTMSALYAYEDKVVIAEIGDSPVFRFSEGSLIPVIGSGEAAAKLIGVSMEGDNLKPDIIEISDMDDGDLFIVCSAGLTDTVSADTMKEILSQGGSAKRVATQLLKSALENGGEENASVIVAKIELVAKYSVEETIPSVLNVIMSEPIADEVPASPVSRFETVPDTHEDEDEDDAEVSESKPSYEKFSQFEDIYSSSNEDEDADEPDKKALVLPPKKELVIYAGCIFIVVLCIILSISLAATKNSKGKLEEKMSEVLASVKSEQSVDESSYVAPLAENEWTVDGEWSLDILSVKRQDVNSDGKKEIVINYSYTDLSGTGREFDMLSNKVDESICRVDIDKIINKTFFGNTAVRVRESAEITKLDNSIYFADDSTCTHVKISIGMKDSAGETQFKIFIIEVE